MIISVNPVNFWYLLPLIIIIVVITGCTTANQDEEYKSLVIEALTQLDPINEHIMKPYQGMSVDELNTMKSFAQKAKGSAEQMTLSDTSKKSREFFIRAMETTISGLSTLEPDIDPAAQRILSTAPATNAFIQIKSDLGSAADVIKVPNKKGY